MSEETPISGLNKVEIVEKLKKQPTRQHFGFDDSFTEEKYSSNRDRKRLRLASLLTSSAESAKRRSHPSNLPEDNLKEYQPLSNISFMRYMEPSLLKAENLDQLIGEPDTYAKAATMTSQLFGAHKLTDDKSIFKEDVSGVLNSKIRNPLSYIDELPELANIDCKAPSEGLLRYIRHMATVKIMNHKDRQHFKGLITDSALIALGVVVEEMFRDFMVRWAQNGYPLDMNNKNIISETMLQLKGGQYDKVSVDLLMNKVITFFDVEKETAGENNDENANLEIFRNIVSAVFDTMKSDMV